MIELLARSRELPILFFLGLTIAVVLILVNARQRRREFANRCEGLARLLGGRYVPGSIFSHHQVLFTTLDRPSCLELHDGKNPVATLAISLPSKLDGRLKIGRSGFGEFLTGLFEAPRLRTGDAAFDSAFTIRCWPEPLGRRVFSPERRGRAMAAVRRLGDCPEPTIEIRDGFLVIRVQDSLAAPELAGIAARTGEELVRFLLDLDIEPGIQWGAVVERLSGRCPICTTTLAEPLVRCERCRSPHHQECWDYAGHCAVYGCEPHDGQRAA